MEGTKMTTSNSKLEAKESEFESRRMADAQQTANATGFSIIMLESSWWGNELFGDWTDTLTGVVDFQTDDAYHLAMFDAGIGRSDMHSWWQYDEFVPKSAVDGVVHPDEDTVKQTPAAGKSEGEIRIGGTRYTQWGEKIALTGDTYDAFAADDSDVYNQLDWEVCHQDFDDNNSIWFVDMTEDSIAHVREVLVRAGFDVVMHNSVTPSSFA